MNNRNWSLFVVSSVVGGVLLASACSGKSISHRDGDTSDDDERGGTGGTIDRGGTSGTGGTIDRGGTSGTGGIPPTGGVAGTTFPGGSAGTSGTSGTSGSGGGPTCALGGPQGTPSARRTIPFSLTPGSGGAGGAPNEASDLELSGAGGSGTGESGCRAITDGWECLGDARTTSNGGSPLFTFVDGSTLAWTPGAEPSVGPPRVRSGEFVYVEYTTMTPPVCPFCGSSSLASLVMRSGDGPIIWYGEEGSRVGEQLQERIVSLFGVEYGRSFACSVPEFNMDCYLISRSVYDIVLGTTPEQLIPHATPTRVSTPRGIYDVIWASSEQSEIRIPMCSDGRAPARDRGFAANRVN